MNDALEQRLQQIAQENGYQWPAGELAEAMRLGAEAAMEWFPIETAPMDGQIALVYRPLAFRTNDEPIAFKRLIGGNHPCWAQTVPEGQERYNPTNGACHVTHFHPLPQPPKVKP